MSVTCAACQTARPAAETYERIPGSGERFCSDTAGCRRRMAYVGDPVGEVAAAPPPAVPGATCSICGATEPPGGVYHQTAHYVCLDRAGCTERSVGFQFLTAHREDFPEVAVTKMTAVMHDARAAGGAGPVSGLGTPNPAALRQAEHDAAVALAAAARR